MEPALELEHAIGYSTVCGIICWHPNGKKFLYAAGASVVISDLVDPHDQVSQDWLIAHRTSAPAIGL